MSQPTRTCHADGAFATAPRCTKKSMRAAARSRRDGTHSSAAARDGTHEIGAEDRAPRDAARTHERDEGRQRAARPAGEEARTHGAGHERLHAVQTLDVLDVAERSLHPSHLRLQPRRAFARWIGDAPQRAEAEAERDAFARELLRERDHGGEVHGPDARGLET